MRKHLRYTYIVVSIVALVVAGCVQPASDEVAPTEVGNNATWTVTPTDTVPPPPTDTPTATFEIVEVTETPTATSTATPTEAVSGLVVEGTAIAQSDVLPIEGDQAVFVTMTTYDILLSAMYLLFVLALAKPVFRHVLPAFTRHSESQSGDPHFAHMADESAAAYRRVLQAGFRKDTFKSLFLAVLVVAVSVVLSQLLPAGMQSAGTIVLITTLGLACSLSASVRRWATSFHLGMYLVLVFCFTMGSLTDVGIFSRLDVALFSYIGCLLIGSLLLHALLCRLFRIDVDTFLMASAAAIMSVPFVPVVAGALRNPGLIVPGFAAAILGYVAGNYLGIGVAFLTRWLLAA